MKILYCQNSDDENPAQFQSVCFFFFLTYNNIQGSSIMILDPKMKFHSLCDKEST